MKGLLRIMLVGGAILCAIPFAVLGVGLVVLAGVMLLLSPVADRAEQTTIDETRQTGNGGCAFVWSAILIIAIGAATIAAAMTVVGLVQP